MSCSAWSQRIAFLAIALAMHSTCVADSKSAGRDAWIATLGRMTLQPNDYQTLNSFIQSDPELVFTTLRDGWKQIDSANVRQVLIQLLVNGTRGRLANGRLEDNYTPNPHLLDILALGLNDPSSQVNTVAAQAAAGVSFRDIRSASQLDEWRRTTGERPIRELLVSACLSAVRDLSSMRLDEKLSAFRALLSFPFHSGRYMLSVNRSTVSGYNATGLIGLRRQAAIDAGVIGLAGRCLNPDNPQTVRELALRLIAHIGPDDESLAKLEPDIRREAPPLLERPNVNEIYDMLAQLKARWVIDSLVQCVSQGGAVPANLSWAVANALGNTGDARAIPSLIALYDTANPNDFQGQIIERGLTQLTGVPYEFNSNHDGDWWRDWWHEHKAEFPVEARAMPYPTIPGVHRSAGFSLRRHAERRTIPTGAREYWLVSPGIISVPSESADPGLVIVLTDQLCTMDLARSWEETAGKAWDGRYLVALVGLPGCASLGKSPEAPTGELVAATIKDAESRTRIDSSRVFMIGEGDSGPDVYACSLEKGTLAHGFLMISSAFHTVQLPPLAAAHGRRYYLLHSKTDRKAPYFLAEAAEILLKREGAAVKLAPFDAAHNDRQNTSGRTMALRQAIQWLESGK